jgi:hypothetical protein
MSQKIETPHLPEHYWAILAGHHSPNLLLKYYISVVLLRFKHNRTSTGTVQAPIGNWRRTAFPDMEIATIAKRRHYPFMGRGRCLAG